MTITLPGNKPENTEIVASLLKAPTVIAGRVIDPQVEFLSNYLFGANVPTPSGTVQYQVARLDNEYAARGDAQVVQPGSEFPMLDITRQPSVVGATDKYGTGYIVTYEAVEQNDVQPMIQGNRLIRNHVTRLDAQRALTVIETAVAEHNQAATASAIWSTKGAAWTDLGTALAAAPAGYNYDTLILNKQDAWVLAQAEDLRNAYVAGSRGDAQIYQTVFSPLNGLLGLNVIINEFVPTGKAYLVQRGVAGFVALTKDFYIDVIDQRETERFLVKGGKKAAPFVNEPAAVQVINGIS